MQDKKKGLFIQLRSTGDVLYILKIYNKPNSVFEKILIKSISDSDAILICGVHVTGAHGAKVVYSKVGRIN